MRVLVTGAAGFLGRAFVRHHVERGDYVLGVDDMSSPHAEWITGWPDNIEGDALHTLHALTFVPDRVYHFAAPVGGREKIEGDPLYNADSLRLDAGLFRWATRFPAATIVYPSSSAVYGVRNQGASAAALSENMFDPLQLYWEAPDEMYGFTKMVGEVLAQKAARYGVNTLCIRPFSGYGEDQSLEYPVPSIVARVLRREDPLDIWGDGEQMRDFIHVDDLVLATTKRVDAGVHGYARMNIGWGIPTSFNTVAKMAVDIAGYYPRIRHLTDKPVGVQRRYCDPSEMLKYHSPTISLKDGLERMLR